MSRKHFIYYLFQKFQILPSDLCKCISILYFRLFHHELFLKVSKWFAAIATIFMPLSLFTGMMGMNMGNNGIILGGVPEEAVNNRNTNLFLLLLCLFHLLSNAVDSFWVITVVLTMLGLLNFVYFKWKHWV